MEWLRRFARNYWLAYYFIYVGGVAVCAGRYWQRLWSDEGILWLAAIFGASAGFALLVVIILEVTGRMVLLIPAAMKKLKDEGREEGLREGRREGRKEERQRIVEALRQLGEREDGSIHITLTPDVVKLLMGETESDP